MLLVPAGTYMLASHNLTTVFKCFKKSPLACFFEFILHNSGSWGWTDGTHSCAFFFIQVWFRVLVNNSFLGWSNEEYSVIWHLCMSLTVCMLTGQCAGSLTSRLGFTTTLIACLNQKFFSFYPAARLLTQLLS